MTEEITNKRPADNIDKRWSSQYESWFETVSTLNIDELLRTSNPEYNFQEIKPQVEMTVSSFGELSRNYNFWASLPQSKQQNIEGHTSQLLSSIDAIRSFDAKQNNAWQQRQNLVSTFTSYYDQIYTSMIEGLHGYLGMRAYSQELSSNFSKQAKEQLDQISAAKTRIDKIQKSVEDAASVASEIANTATANFFDIESAKYNNTASRWLWAVWVSITIFGVAAGYFVYESASALEDGSHPASQITTLSLRVVLVATLLIALRFVTKNYNANMHLAVTNKHRANALKTVEAYRQGAHSEDTKDAILSAGVMTAFSQSETGYISTKEGAGSSDDNVGALVSLAKIK